LTYREALERAAGRLGIELSYTDTWGRQHDASEPTLRTTLAALGIAADSAGEIEAALARQHEESWSHALDSTLVLREDAESVRLRIPAEQSGESVKLEFQWEDGSLEHHWFWLPELKELERSNAGGREFIAKRVPLPAAPRLGYHHLRVYAMKETGLETFGEARLIVCPKRVRTLEGRVAGVALSLYGLRSARNWGCGDFTDLRAVIDAFAPAGAAFVALNPLHAIPNRQPYNTSPYLPECSLYRNYLYLDVERVPGYAASDAPYAAIAAVRAAEFVEYERVAQIKLAALRAAFQRFLDAGRTEAFMEYATTEAQRLEDFAVYCALWEELHGADPEVWLWTQWPEPYRDPRSAAVAAWAAGHRKEVVFYKFLQWQIDCQLAETQAHALACGMKIGLYHDLALATDRFGADLWANREFYQDGSRVGAPPDELAPSGQDWGFPPPNRRAHRDNGYALFAQSIRNNARHGGALRIDHVMRFFRLFWIPDELTAADGLYVRDYADDLLGVLALESVRGNFIVIGEDLGTVAGEVRQRLGELGILGYRVLWFERNGDGSFRLPQEYPEFAAVSTTTHDLPTLQGFPLGRDIEARLAAGLIDEEAYQAQWASRRQDVAALEEALNRANSALDPLNFVMQTPCSITIVNSEDLTGETEQQNLPASTWHYPNWRRKMRIAVEDLGPVAADLRQRIERSGRR
jgi:4-alpha-glucanotransferase